MAPHKGDVNAVYEGIRLVVELRPRNEERGDLTDTATKVIRHEQAPSLRHLERIDGQLVRSAVGRGKRCSSDARARTQELDLLTLEVGSRYLGLTHEASKVVGHGLGHVHELCRILESGQRGFGAVSRALVELLSVDDDVGVLGHRDVVAQALVDARLGGLRHIRGIDQRMRHVPIGNGKETQSHVGTLWLQMYREVGSIVSVDGVYGCAGVEGDSALLHAVIRLAHALIEALIEHLERIILTDVVLADALIATLGGNIAPSFEVVHEVVNERLWLRVLVAHETVVGVCKRNGAKDHNRSHQHGIANPKYRHTTL